MKSKENPTIISCADDILKCFCDDKGHILIDENCDPNFIPDLNKYKTIPNKFKLIKTELICTNCNSTMHEHDVVNFKLNKTLSMLKVVYKCDNDECGCSVRPTWDKYINPDSNYTKFMMNISLELGLIENISYEK